MGERTGRMALLYAASILAALALSSLLVSLTGGSARAVWSALLDGSLRSPGAWGLTLTTMAPLLIVAVGAIVATRAGLINIGQEGQLLLGASFAAYVAVRLPGPGPLVLSAALGAAAVGGGLWAGIAAVLKVWRNVPEVLSTLLLTFIAVPLLTWGLRHTWLLGDRTDRRQHINSGEQIPGDARLPSLEIFGNRIDSAVILAVGAAGVVAYIVSRTRLGARIDVLGLNPRAAQRFGVPRRPLTAAVLIASGCFAGLAGAVLLTGGASGDRLSVGYSGNYGWDGLLVALVARNRVLVAIPTAFVFAALRTGSSFLAATGVDRRMTDVVQALLVLALLIPPAIEHLSTFGGRASATAVADAPPRSPRTVRRERPRRDLRRRSPLQQCVPASGGVPVRGHRGVGRRTGRHAEHLRRGDAPGRCLRSRSRNLLGSVGRRHRHPRRLRRRARRGRRPGEPQPPPDRQSIRRRLGPQCPRARSDGLPRHGHRPAPGARPVWRIPVLAELPLIGEALFARPWPAYFVYALVPALWWLVYRTRWGLEARSVGERPEAADVSGIDVNARRRQAVYLCGLTSGFGGAFLVLGQVNQFQPNIVNGRGFIAIAAVIFGGWTLRGTVIGCVLFGFVEALTIAIPVAGLRDRPVHPRRRSLRGGSCRDVVVRHPRPPAAGAWPSRSSADSPERPTWLRIEAGVVEQALTRRHGLLPKLRRRRR